LLDILNEDLLNIEVLEGGMHMIPGDIKMHDFNFHIFVELNHVGPLVMIFAAEQVGQEQDHGGVEFRNVTDVLEEEGADLVVAEDVLVELGHDLFELVMTANLLEQSL
jgi:hypothetical protein